MSQPPASNTSANQQGHRSRIMEFNAQRTRRPSMDAITNKPPTVRRPSWHLSNASRPVYPPMSSSSMTARPLHPMNTSRVFNAASIDGVTTRLAAAKAARMAAADTAGRAKENAFHPAKQTPTVVKQSAATWGVNTRSASKPLNFPTVKCIPSAVNQVLSNARLASSTTPSVKSSVGPAPTSSAPPTSSARAQPLKTAAVSSAKAPPGGTSAPSQGVTQTSKPSTGSSKTATADTAAGQAMPTQPTSSAEVATTRDSWGNSGASGNFTLNDFNIGRPLGKGRFGNVYLVQEKNTRYTCAMKVLYKTQINQYGLIGQVRREVEIQTHLRHPYILKMHSWFYDTSRVFMVLQYAPGGELYKLIKKVKHFDEPTSAKYTYQVASALSYCHARRVIHRDLKPENILIDVNGDLKLSDFGWSVVSAGEDRKTHCGTLDYQAPEMITGGHDHDNKVDIWSLACMIYEFLVGKPPFETAEQGATQRRIRSVQYRCPPFTQPGVPFPANAQLLIKQCLVLEPSQRPTAEQLMSHVWVGDNYKHDVVDGTK